MREDYLYAEIRFPPVESPGNITFGGIRVPCHWPHWVESGFSQPVRCHLQANLCYIVGHDAQFLAVRQSLMGMLLHPVVGHAARAVTEIEDANPPCMRI